jgi:NACalpha-BTF3-like transcription factor
MPFKATTARAPGAHGKGAVSVTSSQGAAFGANFQPTPQSPPPTHLHPNNVQSPASFAAPQNMSSSSVSTILPSDSASVIHADLQGNSALTGSVIRTGQVTYNQNMTNTSGRSDSGFQPPTANMATVRRPVAFTTNISARAAAHESDIRLVMDLAQVNRCKAIKALEANKNDPVDAILALEAKYRDDKIRAIQRRVRDTKDLTGLQRTQNWSLAEVMQPPKEFLEPMELAEEIDGWVTVGNACPHNRQALGGDPPATEFINYNAVLGTIDIAAEFQNVTYEEISADTNDHIQSVSTQRRAVDQRSAHKDNSGARAMKHRTKHKRKRRRKPTMRGVQFTNSPLIIPRPHIATEFPSNENYLNIRKYINVYRVCGKAQAQPYLTRHKMMSLNLGTEIDARELDPYESTCNGVIQHVNMNGNYEVDFGQGRMRYISECTFQEILLARRVVRDRYK